MIETEGDCQAVLDDVLRAMGPARFAETATILRRGTMKTEAQVVEFLDGLACKLNEVADGLQGKEPTAEQREDLAGRLCGIIALFWVLGREEEIKEMMMHTKMAESFRRLAENSRIA